MFSIQSFFGSLPQGHESLFSHGQPVWNALKKLKEYLQNFPFEGPLEKMANAVPLPRAVVLHNGRLLDEELEIEYNDATKGKLSVRHRGTALAGASVIMAGAVLQGGPIRLGRGVLIESGALLKGPAVIGDHTEIRQGAYIRGYCLTGARCVIGHTTEVKHAILLDDAKAGHFAYLGDSILGNRVNLGAGTKLANLRFHGDEVRIRTQDDLVETGLRKFGAIMGDDVQTGCNSVTNPGTLLGKGSVLLPNTTAASGLHGPGTILS
ncbi:MAG: hypothetical protein P8130_07595 [Deltaproteobacteria bacterium]